MAEYIEREKAIAICQSHYEHCLKMHDFSGDSVAYDIRSDIQGLPTADVVEVKHGEWEEYWDNDYMEYFHRCSKCKNDAPAKRDTYCDQVLTNYCPNCGAKMDLKEGAKE